MKYKSLLALFIGVLSLSAQAEQRWFEVELLLFERNVDIKNLQEHLSSDEITVDTKQSIKYLQPKRTEVCVDGEPCFHVKNPVVIDENVLNPDADNVIFLDSSQLQLTEQRKKLAEHNSFKPLLHMVWRMPVESGRTAKPIHLFAGENLAVNIAKRQQVALLEQPKVLELEDESKARPTAIEFIEEDLIHAEIAPEFADKWAIDGNFKVYLDHYLFIDSQLIIRKEITEEVKQVEQVVDMIDGENGVQIANPQVLVTTEPELQTVVKEILFDQNRRLRSEEIHYLDHPLVGMIVQIRKIPKEQLPGVTEQ